MNFFFSGVRMGSGYTEGGVVLSDDSLQELRSRLTELAKPNDILSAEQNDVLAAACNSLKEPDNDAWTEPWMSLTKLGLELCSAAINEPSKSKPRAKKRRRKDSPEAPPAPPAEPPPSQQLASSILQASLGVVQQRVPPHGIRMGGPESQQCEKTWGPFYQLQQGEQDAHVKVAMAALVPMLHLAVTTVASATVELQLEIVRALRSLEYAYNHVVKSWKKHLPLSKEHVNLLWGVAFPMDKAVEGSLRWWLKESKRIPKRV